MALVMRGSKKVREEYMEINYGSRYQDANGNVVKLIGAVDLYNGTDTVLLFAPVHAGTVGDVFYIAKESADKTFFPVSKYF